MSNKTPLFEQHVSLGGKMVDFAGWQMPIHFGSQIEEHKAVRRDAGMFDVSHMAILDISGEGAHPFLRSLLANNVDRLTQDGKALYSCMLNDLGGVIDDLIVYCLTEGEYRIVSNAGTHDKVLAWIKSQSQSFDLALKERENLAMIAIQGPNAREKVHLVIGEEAANTLTGLPPFTGKQVGENFISRTGYTGEDGYEVMLPAQKASQFWLALNESGVKPIGLGARDTLRLEAGMNLYGSDMDETTSPLESGLGWTIAWQPEDRVFIGRTALEDKHKHKQNRKLVGLLLHEKGVLRGHQKVVLDGKEIGEITSGSFSPSLGKAIAFARIKSDVSGQCSVEIRGKSLAVEIVKPPFVRHGKSCID
ncbi:MAG: glycine cleavage system aminomethyltransferase GcvT [Gammaproteobacteria bacterium]